MFEGLILRELKSDDLHRSLRPREVVGALLFLASFGLFGGALMAIPVQWLRVAAAVVVFSLLPTYIRWMVRVFRASASQPNRGPVPPPPGPDHAA